jgi:hypothetical protein
MAQPTHGAVPIGGRADTERKRGGLLKVLLPLLLLLLIVAVVLFLLLRSGSNDIKVGGTKLLPTKAGYLQPLVGKLASGTKMKVLSVNAKDGFFVGKSTKDRIYVEFGGATGVDEKGTLPAKGDSVDLKADVRPSPQDPATALHLPSADAAVVTREGGFLNAASVKKG